MQFEAVAYSYRRRDRPVIKDLTWRVPPGRTVLLGPNGAGKSTLLSLGCGALRPRSGRVVRRRGFSDGPGSVGWMPQHITPVKGLTAAEQVAYCGWLAGLPARAATDAARSTLAEVGLAEVCDERSDRVSGGQLRRIGLAQSLVGSPDVLLLDEPTVGLDPAQRARFRTVLAGLDPELAVVVSTHQVDDLDELFDSVALMAAGRIIWTGDVATFLAHAEPGSARPAEDAYGRLLTDPGNA